MRSWANPPPGVLPGMSSRPPGVYTPVGFSTCSRPERWFRPLPRGAAAGPAATRGPGPGAAGLGAAGPPRAARAGPGAPVRAGPALNWLGPPAGPEAPVRPAPAWAVAMAGRYCAFLTRPAEAAPPRDVDGLVIPPRSKMRIASTIMPNENPATAISAPTPIVCRSGCLPTVCKATPTMTSSKPHMNVTAPATAKAMTIRTRRAVPGSGRTQPRSHRINAPASRIERSGREDCHLKSHLGLTGWTTSSAAMVTIRPSGQRPSLR